jgi:uncharacterized protein
MTMKLSSLARDLYEQIAELTIIDAHTHIPSEKEYLAFNYSGLNMFAGGYIQHDLESAGMPAAFKATMREGGHRPVEDWWPQVRPYWEHVRHTSFARALRITAQTVFGLPDIDDETIHAFAERVEADNTPGLYRRALQERCGIRYSITCVDRPSFPDDPGLRGITNLLKVGPERRMVAALAEKAGREVRTLEDAAHAAQTLIRADLARGAVGFKTVVADFRPPDPDLAQQALDASNQTTHGSPCFVALRDYLFDKCLDVACEAHVPVAVHTGYWGDFRQLDPKLMLGFAARRRDVRFDMFHLGMPMIRDAVLIGKNLPNVTLNLTWCPIISQLQTARTLDEMMDLVPLNKIIAFGADYRVSVQKTYGHLVLAREAVASALAGRVEEEEFDTEYALHIAKMWFHDNPERIYKLTPQM